jgi:hypothetical protein
MRFRHDGLIQMAFSPTKGKESHERRQDTKRTDSEDTAHTRCRPTGAGLWSGTCVTKQDEAATFAASAFNRKEDVK